LARPRSQTRGTTGCPLRRAAARSITGLSQLLNAATKSPLQNDVPDLWFLFELLGFLLIKRHDMRPLGLPA